ncbi:MAG: hypothetical protein QW802_05055, partial [Candidatus Altiarchaeota archaeon]
MENTKVNKRACFFVLVFLLFAIISVQGQQKQQEVNCRDFNSCPSCLMGGCLWCERGSASYCTSVCDSFTCYMGTCKNNLNDCAATGATTTTATTTTIPGQVCSDSDGGRNYESSGICKEKGTYTYKDKGQDYCLDSTTLKEWYCSNEKCTYEYKRCEYGCRAGACLP